MTDQIPTDNPDTGRAASARIAEGAERLKQGTSSTVEHTRDAVDRAADKVEHGVHRGTDKMAGAAEYAAEHGREALDQAMDQANGWLDEARDYVRDKPTQSVVMAVAAGWLLGRLMRH